MKNQFCQKSWFYNIGNIYNLGWFKGFYKILIHVRELTLPDFFGLGIVLNIFDDFHWILLLAGSDILGFLEYVTMFEEL